MHSNLTLFGPEAVRNAKPVVPLFSARRPNDRPGDDEVTKCVRRSGIVHLTESDYRHRQKLTFLIAGTAAVLASFVVVFAVMMLFYAEHRLGGSYDQLMDYFWYVILLGTLLFAPFMCRLFLPVYSALGDCFYVVTHRGRRTDLVLSTERQVRAFGCGLWPMTNTPFVLSRTCRVTLRDLNKVSIQFIVSFVIERSRAWDFQDSGNEPEVSKLLARRIATSLKRWSVGSEGPQQIITALAAYDESTEVIARAACETAKQVGVTIEQVTVTSIEPVR